MKTQYSSLFEGKVIKGIPLGPWLDALNKRICEHVGRDARNLQVGHSFFMEREKPIASFSKFARVIQEDILPLLEEYCYEDYESLEKILGNTLVDTQSQRLNHDLFDDSRQDELVQALLAPSPDISTVTPAVESDTEEELEDSEGNISGEE